MTVSKNRISIMKMHGYAPLFLIGLLLVLGGLVFAQSKIPVFDEGRYGPSYSNFNLSENLSEGWNLISVMRPMENRTLAGMAELHCGGKNGGWITHGWINRNDQWELVKGSQDYFSGIPWQNYIDNGYAAKLIEMFKPTEVGLGMWVYVDGSSIPAGQLCKLSCGTTVCEPGTPKEGLGT